MIKLQKGPEPAVLTENYDNWTNALLDRIAKGEKPTDAEKGKYRHPDVKEALVKETFGKCAYCESKIRHIAYGDIEHISPKSSDHKLTFLWSNLTLACDLCNTNKGVHTVVDPYVDDPSEYFLFVGALIFGRPGNDKGRFTETQLELNRAELVEKRRDRLENIRNQLDIYMRTTDPDLKKVLRRDMEKNELSGVNEYAAFSRQFLTQLLKEMPTEEN